MQLCCDVSPDEINHFHGLDAQNKHNARGEIHNIDNDVHDDGDVDVPFALHDQRKWDQTYYARHDQPRRPDVEQRKENSMDRGSPIAKAGEARQEITAKIDFLCDWDDQGDGQELKEQGRDQGRAGIYAQIRQKVIHGGPPGEQSLGYGIADGRQQWNQRACQQ